jgi:endonuclease/exonuclease/phosphatase family metal-dependent hydrolase
MRIPEERRMRPMVLRQQILVKPACSTPRRTLAVPRYKPGRKVRPDRRLRVLTYNIHSCIHMDGRTNPDRTGDVIAALDPDITALQEVDVNRARTGFSHQAEQLAGRLGLACRFFPLLEKGDEQYGLAILSRFPVISLRHLHFPSSPKNLRREPRGAQLAEIDTPLGPVRVLNTHLGLAWRERRRQIRALLEDRWFARAPNQDLPLVVCGDFNAGARSFVYKRLTEHVADIQLQPAQHGYPRATYSSRYPLLRLDHIFVSRQLRAERVFVPNDEEARIVSDHLPLCGELVPAQKNHPPAAP